MDCPLIRTELVAYHFGAADEEVRDAVDAHLVGCPECLRAYLRLKRHLEIGSSARPSAHVRERLRRDVEVAFRPTVRQRARRLLERPIPLYQGLAVAAVALVLALVLPRLARHDASVVSADPGPRVDSARPAAVSLTLY
jgi:anti-sigma factor RsiW